MTRAKLYHGTTSNRLKGILKYGLKEGSFITNNRKEAEHYALTRTVVMNNSILRNKGLDFAKAHKVKPVVITLRPHSEDATSTHTYPLQPLSGVKLQNYRLVKTIYINKRKFKI